MTSECGKNKKVAHEAIAQCVTDDVIKHFDVFCDLLLNRRTATWNPFNIQFYYMKESVLLGTKPLVDSIRHFIRDPSGVFSVCHLCECRIVQ